MASKRAQAAFEFLTTYGWMLLMAAAVGGTLAYFGVFDTNKNVPNQCIFGFEFSCNKYVLLSDGVIRVELGNKLGEPLEVVAFTCTYENDASRSMDVSALGTWEVGDNLVLTCPAGGMTLEPNNRAEVSALLQYRKVSGGFTKSVQGSVTGPVVQA